MHVDMPYICNIYAPWAGKEMSHLSTVMCHRCLKRTLHTDVKNTARGLQGRRPEMANFGVLSVLYGAKTCLF